MLTKEDDINQKIQLTKRILDNVYEILGLFKPLLSKMIKMPEANDYKENGTFEKAAFLFGNISDLCEEIEGRSFPSKTFLKSLDN